MFLVKYTQIQTQEYGTLTFNSYLSQVLCIYREG